MRRRQKKVLSLVLCVAMMLSVMVVGAGAAFSDQSKIKNTEAVDACTALNIIGGYPDGSFKPEGNITRAEATKMICVALNGGKDPATSTNATPTFSDVRTNANAAWAEGYIESCVAQGIVSGVGGGKFAPAGNVTGVQLAKMLLVALGYNSDIEGFTGNAWATNVNVRATQRGLYDGLEKMDTAAAISRDNAAQMVWNALQALEVKYDYTLVSDKGNLTSTTTLVEKNITLLADKYSGAGVYEGVLTGSGKYSLDGTTGKDKVFMTTVDKIDGKVAPKDLGPQKWDCDKDMTALLGQYVKVLVNNKSDAYGVFPVEDENTVVTAAFKDVKIDGGKIKVNGTSYNYKADAEVEGVVKTAATTNPKASAVALKIADLTGNYAEVASGDQITFISNDGDDTFDLAIVNPLKAVSGNTLAKVTYVSSTEFVAGGETYKFEDVIAPTDLKKGDYVAYYENTFTGDKQFVKATEVKGKVTSTKDSAKEVKIGDNWYTVGNKTTDRPFAGALLRKGDEVTLNSTVTVQVINDVIYYADSNGTGSTDTALVLAATGSMNADGDYQVKLLFADGTTKLVAADDAYTGLSNKMVTWEISDDLYELTAISSTNKAGGDTYVDKQSNKGFVKSSKTVDGKKVASDAVVYVNYKDGTKDKQKVMTGSELNALGSDFKGELTYVVDEGLISLAYIDSTAYLPGANATQVYGYIVSNVTENNDNNTKYKQYDVYTTEGKLVEGVKQKATTEVNKGDIIKLSLSSDNYAEGVQVLNLSANVSALRNFGKDYISVVKNGAASSIVNLDDNVKYLVINTKDVKGVGNEADLEKAAETGTTNQYFANVTYYTETAGGDAVLVVIDSTGKWYPNGSDTATTVTEVPAP